MKKYLVFGLSEQLGGVESFLMNYISKMMDENNVFEFIVFDDIPGYIRNSAIRECKMHVVNKRIKKPLSYYIQLKKILQEGNYDIVWYNVCTLSDITLIKLAKKYHVPCRIVHSHNGSNMGGKIVAYLHEKNKKKIINYASDFFACSNVAADFMFPTDIIKDGKVIIIKNAIDTNKYKYNKEIREDMRRQLGISNELLIGHVGRFHFQKNHKFILEIFEEVLKKQADAKILLIGNGELKEGFCKEAEEKGIIKSIIMLENRSDVNNLMQAMDVFVFPSLFEGLPISLVEAQAADLPCVISDTISEEILLTDKMRMMSLDDSAEKWAGIIIEKNKNIDRIDVSNILKKKGYDIEQNAIELKQYMWKIS